MNAYQPKPIDTSHCVLPDGVMDLREKLAENSHEIWAMKRMSEGWTWGPDRDDARKKHPCLVPYRELPEVEKEYDRAMAIETLKLIVALGYSIRKD